MRARRAPRARGLALALVALGAVIVAVALLLAGGGADAPGGPVGGSTLRSALADPDSDGELERVAGEPARVRTELAPASPETGEIATLAQITDAHVRDEESPARAVQIDRLGDPVTEAFRPQEALSAQVLAAAVSTVNALRPDAVLVTGDLIDSAQRNELDQAMAVLDGGEVDPDSGDPGYDGPQQASNPDPFVYRPDVDAPEHPGLLDEAQRPFDSPGLEAPWYPALGNHDLLVQGEAPPQPLLERIALGSERLAELDTDVEIPDVPRRRLLAAALADGLPGTTAATPADPGRRYLTSAELVGELGADRGLEVTSERLDYGFDVGLDLRVVVLDLVDRGGGAAGEVSATETAAVEAALDSAGDRWVIVVTHQPLAESEGGAALLDRLGADPRVIAAASGHSHRNTLEPREGPGGGLWLIGTSSLADFPEQVRALRVAETEDGVVLDTWMLDHGAGPGGLAETSRELAFVDAQGGRPRGFAGGPADRNARLYLSR